MADKDINIHVKAKGTPKAKSDLDGVARSGKGVGDQTAKGQGRATVATDKASKSLNKQGSLFGGLTSKLLGYLAAFMGINSILSMLNKLIEKLEKIKEIQDELYHNALTPLQLGQQLEAQTGTVGKQDVWAKQIIEVQRAGGFASPEAAMSLLRSGDIAFGASGGIKNSANMQLLKGLAPMFGSASMSGGEINKFFEFATTSGVENNLESYKQFFAKMQQGSNVSKAETFGQFITGLQGGGTSYLSQGGSLDEAIALFTSARSVTPSDAEASTLLKQLTSLSSGGNATRRKAMEDALGVKWSELGSQDERMQATLDYLKSIPQSERAIVLGEAGFGDELTLQASNMVGKNAAETLRSARTQMSQTDTSAAQSRADAWMDSTAARRNIAEANRLGVDLESGPQFARSSERRGDAKKELDKQVAERVDNPLMPDEYEDELIAIEQLSDDYRKAAEDATGKRQKELTGKAQRLDRIARQIKRPWVHINRYEGVMLTDTIHEYTKDLESLTQPQGVSMLNDQPQAMQGGDTTINNNNYINDNSQHFYPAAGDDLRGPRTPVGIR